MGCGIELDWIEGREEAIEALVAERGFDLVLGSVHWLGGHAVDHPDYTIWEELPADEVWRRYFAQVRAAAASGVFDVLAHLDLAKVFGHAASESVIASEHDQTADAIAAAGIAVEISTAGLRKAAGELYPSADAAARAPPARCADHARLRRARARTISDATTTAR